MENSPEIIHGRVLLRVAILVGCCFCEIIGKLLAKQARWSPTYISATFSKRIPTGIFPVFFPKVFRTAIYNSLHIRCLRETSKNSAKYCIHLSVNIYRAYKNHSKLSDWNIICLFMALYYLQSKKFWVVVLKNQYMFAKNCHLH